MCEFISFKIESTPDGLKIHTAPSLSDHSDIKEDGYEGEWREDGTLEVRVSPEISDNVKSELEAFVKKMFRTRKYMADVLIMEYLLNHVLPGNFWEHSKLDDRKLRLFACDCAERMLPLFENAYPNDKRPRKAIDVARLFAEGKATDKERAAARAAAYYAGAAAGAAAYYAGAAAYAAEAAAGDAAGDAAYAAGDAENKEQAAILLKYIKEA
jgi:hypothetical protein